MKNSLLCIKSNKITIIPSFITYQSRSWVMPDLALHTPSIYQYLYIFILIRITLNLITVAYP
jgi:hypothetical protein